MRSSGVLLHISSLPAPHGIGTMGKSAYDFVDFLKLAGQKYWQILPLTPASAGNSPYSSCSVFAGNPYFIDLIDLRDKKLLTDNDLAGLPQESTNKTDYDACEKLRIKVLKKAFANSASLDKKIESFRQNNSAWVEDYALFMAIKTQNKGKHYLKWDEKIIARNPKAIKEVKSKLGDEINFWVFTQYLFTEQWVKLKKYANKNGIEIVGDMPIYAAADSSDVWANPKVFQLDKNFRPTHVGGVPPDYFSKTGQLWGNPLYDWKYLQKTDYAWWIERLGKAAELYDVVRIDHFRAIDTYCSIDASAKTAIDGVWKKGPGLPFIHAVEKAHPKLKLIAEDLGGVTPSVKKLLADSKLPGMKVLLFAFDDEDSDFLPYHIPKNSVAYIGTHDNDTVNGWVKSANKATVKLAAKYMCSAEKETNWAFIRELMACPADMVIVQMQDLLGLDNGARMNVPGTPSGNWVWRLQEGEASPKLAKKLNDLTKLYNREPQKKPSAVK